MDSYVIDTNCLIMMISAQNKYHDIWNAFLSGKFYLCVSTEILEEYEEVISRNLSPRLATYILYTITERNNVRRLSPAYRFRLIESDPDDNKFVDCAIVANAKFIVTEDHHFNVLKQVSFPKVDIENIDSFYHEICQHGN